MKHLIKICCRLTGEESHTFVNRTIGTLDIGTVRLIKRTIYLIDVV